MDGISKTNANVPLSVAPRVLLSNNEAQNETAIVKNSQAKLLDAPGKNLSNKVKRFNPVLENTKSFPSLLV